MFHQGGCDVILRAEGLEAQRRTSAPSGLERLHKIGGLSRDMETGGLRECL